MENVIELLKNNDYLNIKKIIQNGFDINQCDEDEVSVLAHSLILRVDEDIIDLLINNGANLEEIDNDGLSILDYAVTYSNLHIVKKIIEKGNIDVNKITRRSKFTPLMAAVSYNKKDIVEYLLEKGANKSYQDQSGFKAEDFARKMKKEEILALLNSSS